MPLPESFEDIMAVRAQAKLDTDHQLLIHLRNSFHNKTVEIFFSAMNNSVGYIAWADIDRHSLHMIKTYQTMPIYEYEWSEGNICLIFDIVFIPGFAKTAKAAFLEFLRTRKAIAYLKNKRFRLYLRSHGRYKVYR